MKLLLVEDERIVRITVRDALIDAGYAVTECADGTSALRALESEAFDILLTDVRLPGMDGITLFRAARRAQARCSVVLMTGFADTEDAVTVMREGARDYIAKPFEMDELILRLARVRDEIEFRGRMKAGAPPAGSPLWGLSAAMARLRDLVAAAAGSDVPVLITGETGTGKDLCARSIHEGSRRAAKPFVAVNCAAIPEGLIESELFGHVKGAFSGAERNRTGKFEAAHGGTLFLDDVGELAPGSQAKLLRAIESSTFEPAGSNRSITVDVRTIAATNRDLADAASSFRRDLYYGLNVIEIRIPPLRERRADVPLLVRGFLEQIAGRLGTPVAELSPAAAAALGAHDYPGNVRELLHALERAVALSRGQQIELGHLPEEFARPGAPAPSQGGRELRPLGEAVAEFEREYIERALAHTGGQRTQAASLLGISRKSLWERLRDSRGRGGSGRS